MTTEPTSYREKSLRLFRAQKLGRDAQSAHSWFMLDRLAKGKARH
jgi:hypothetical protein